MAATPKTIYELISSFTNGTLATNNVQNQKERHRELILQVQPNATTSFLKFVDTQFTWYNIPLGETSVTKKTETSKNDNVLIPVIPLCYTTPDLDPTQAIAPRKGGYLYIYVGDYLWRELEVLNNGFFRDVNLHKYQGKDSRPATVERDNRILLPHKVKGSDNVVSMCYSEIQWSWARINAMGGMDKKDFRIDENNPPTFASDVGVSKSQAAKNRNKRMQEMNLCGYKKGFPAEIPKGKKARVEPIGGVSSKLYFLKLHQKSDIPAIYLHDSLGIANGINKDLDTLTSFLDTVVAGISTEKHYKSAVLAYQTFFNDALWEKQEIEPTAMASIDFATDDSSDEVYADRGSESTDKRKSSKSVDKTLLEKLLQVELRKKIRHEIRQYKNRYVEFMDGKFEGKQITANPEHSDFISINETLKDYAELEAPAYGLLWQTFTALIHIMPYDPSVNDRALDIAINHDKIKHDDDPGHLYLKSILKPGHPLYAMLFPDNSQVDEYSKSYTVEVNKIEPVDGSGKFRPSAYAKTFELTQNSLSRYSKVDNSLKQFQKIIADFSMVMGAQVYDVHSKQTTTLTINPIIRLAIAFNDPDLKTLHLVKKGENLSRKLVLTGRVSIFEKVNQSQQAADLGRVADNPGIQSGKVNVINPVTMKAIGSTLLTQIDNNKGKPQGYNALAWYSLFIIPKKSTGEATLDDYDNGNAAFSASAFEKTSKSGNKLAQNISKATSGKTPIADKISNSAALPVAIVVLKAINVLAAVDSLSKAKSTKDKNKYRAKALLAATSIPFALMEVTKQIAGDDKAVKIWAKRFSQMKMDPIKANELATKMFKGHPRIKRSQIISKIKAAAGIKLASTTFAITGTLMSAFEMTDAFMHDDDDAAIAYGVQMVAGLTYALNAAAGAELITIFAATPWGWASLIVIILAGIIASALTDTDLEKWARHGPFALTKADRMTEEYSVADSQSARYAYEALLALLMAPRIKMTKADEFIYVDVLAPGFEAGSNTLTIHSRYSDTFAFKEQKPLDLISWMPIVNKKFPTKTDGLQYTYLRPKISSQAKLFARVQHITKDNFYIPMKPDQSLGKVADPKLIDDNINGWAYAKPLRIIDEPEEDPDYNWDPP